jgi:2-iminobutanoate/2-iminopropanoate deaminase
LETKPKSKEKKVSAYERLEALNIALPKLTPPVGPFSQAVKIDGFLFFSGQVAQDPATGKVVEGAWCPRMNGIYAKYFSQPFPARTTIAAATLPLGACVEIDLAVKA